MSSVHRVGGLALLRLSSIQSNNLRIHVASLHRAIYPAQFNLRALTGFVTSETRHVSQIFMMPDF